MPDLPANHAPTLFLHGRDDLIVPIGTAEAYRTALVELGIQTSMIVDESAGHEWIAAAPNAIVDWLDTHP